MNTFCPHCHKWFEVSDKALGKNAKCRSCAKMFVIAPASVEQDESALSGLPQPGGSTVHLPAVHEDEVDDPFSALADAAEASGYERMAAVHEHAREHGSSSSRRQRGEVRGQATGASAAVVCGAIGLVLAIAMLVLVILAATGVVPKNVGLIMGLFLGGLVTAVVSLVGVVQGGGARKRIRRARGTLHGASQATTGILLGWAALAIVLAAGITLLVSISRSGPIVLDQREVQE